MKAIYGKLSINKQYEIIEANKAKDCICVCDNCSKPIKNIAIIKDSDNKFYNVGLDCATSLSETGSISNFTALIEAKKHISKMTKLYSFIKKEMETVNVIIHKGDVFFNLGLKNSRFCTYQLTQSQVDSLPMELKKIINAKKAS